MKMSSEPKILAILCKWCSYAGADLAGTSRFVYPPNIKIVQVPCSGRVEPMMIFKSLVHGYDGILVSGCHMGDCHYSTGNYLARRRFAVIKHLLSFIGVDPTRFHYTWISAAEGKKFAEVCHDFTERLKALAGKKKVYAQEARDR